MGATDAKFWIDVIGLIMGALWFAGAWFVMRASRLLAEPRVDSADVAREPANVMQRLAREIAAGRPGSPFQRATIEAANDRELRWSTAGALAHRGTARATGGSGRARVDWEIEGLRSSLLVLARIVVAIGAVVTIGLYIALDSLAVHHENPAVRGQVVQMVQAIHLLWPPFLFAGLARKLRSMASDEVRRTIQNAPFG